MGLASLAIKTGIALSESKFECMLSGPKTKMTRQRKTVQTVRTMTVTIAAFRKNLCFKVFKRGCNLGGQFLLIGTTSQQRFSIYRAHNAAVYNGRPLPNKVTI